MIHLKRREAGKEKTAEISTLCGAVSERGKSIMIGATTTVAQVVNVLADMPNIHEPLCRECSATLKRLNG